MLRKKKKVDKKGISPLIATVLLIGFVVAIMVLVFLWGKNYIEELAQKRGLLAEKEQQCTQVKLEVLRACWSGRTVSELVIRNNANLPIHKFVFTAVGSEGQPVERTGADGKLGALETKTYAINEGELAVEDIQGVNIIPHLRVAIGRYVPCTKQKITAKLYCPTQS